mmetsp:Transcript_12955/g.17899  ORF Transcript_12955/g.17899 Transcript_12955/m.17899 type:complete len:106 (-) Transcript_12955:56-373(-)
MMRRSDLKNRDRGSWLAGKMLFAERITSKDGEREKTKDISLYLHIFSSLLFLPLDSSEEEREKKREEKDVNFSESFSHEDSFFLFNISIVLYLIFILWHRTHVYN